MNILEIKHIPQLTCGLTLALLLSACFDDDKTTQSTADNGSANSQGGITATGDCLRFGDIIQMEFISAPGETAGIIAHGNTIETSITHLPQADKFIVGYHSLTGLPSDILVYPINRSVNDGCVSQNQPLTLRNGWATHIVHTSTGQIVGEQPHTGQIAGDRVLRIAPTTNVTTGKLMLDINETATVHLTASGFVNQSGRVSRAINGQLVTTPAAAALSEIKLTRLDPKEFVYTKAAVFNYNTTSEPCTHGGRLDNGNCFIAHKAALNPSSKIALIPPADNRLRYATLTQPGQNSACSIGVNDNTTHCRLPDFGQNRNYFISNDSFYVTALAEKCGYESWESQPQPSPAAAKTNWANTVSAFPQFSSQGYSSQFDDAAARAVYLRSGGYVASARPCTQ